MSNTSDFVIENGVLKKYVGPGGDVAIPEGVTEIADFAFYPYVDGIPQKHHDGRKNIKSVALSSSVAIIGRCAFLHCENLKKITASDNLARVGASAFRLTAWQKKQSGVIMLNSIIVAYEGDDSELLIPEGTTAIADEVFQGRKQLTTVHLPQTLTSIGSMAFSGCTALNSIHIPASVTEIGSGAFDNTPWLEAHTEDFIIINGILYAYKGTDTNVEIPDTVCTIGPFAFANCRALETVKIPDSVTQIKKSAFYICEKLKLAEIPAAVTAIEIHTFYKCSSLTKVSFSEKMRSIGDAAFYLCKNLMQLPDMSRVEHLGDEAFYGCEKLRDKAGLIIVNGVLFGYHNPGREINIPDSVSRISAGAFESVAYSYDDIEDVEQVVAPPAVFDQVWNLLKPKNKQAVAMNCLKNNTLYGTAAAYIKKSRDKFAPEIIRNDDAVAMARLFSLCKKPDLHTIDKYIEAATGKVNVSAFLLDYKTKNFDSAKVELRYEEKNEIDMGLRDRKLKDWKEIFKLSVKDGCVRISGYKNNEPVIEIPETMEGKPVTVIGDNAFKGNTTVEQVILPSGITSIGSNAFKGCVKLQCIRIPEGVEEINMSAFEDCAALQSIDLPDSIQMIWANAFKGCANLEKVRLPGKLNKIALGLFDGCAALKEIDLPDSVAAIYDYSFRNCKMLTTVSMPENLEIIGQGAFTSCRAITEIVLPDNVRTIEVYAFRSCTKLSKIRIPVNVKSVQPSAFNDCKKLTIYAPAGSYAETYAKKNKIPFVAE